MAEHDDIERAAPAAVAPPEAFAVAVRRQAGRAVARVRGEVDLATVERLRTVLVELEEPEVVLDLRDVSFLDTSGLRLVLEQQRDVERAGRRFALVAGPPSVQRLFEIAGLTERLAFLDPATVAVGDVPDG